MAQKNAKIDDVKRPEKVTPSATSRPILVSGQPAAPTDPMMVPAGDAKPEGDAVQVMSHTAKTITPLTEVVTEKAKEDELKPSADVAVSAETDVAAASPVVADEPVEATEEKPDETKSAADAAVERNEKAAATEGAERDPEAALSAAEIAAAEATAKREQELEALIADGKYTVPINAVQRRQSRIHSLALGLLAVLLALALLDVIADVGIVNLPDSVPHTHFFSGR